MKRKARKPRPPISSQAPGKYLFRDRYPIEKDGEQWVVKIGNALRFRAGTPYSAAVRAVEAGY